MRDLGTLGGAGSRAAGINSAGDVVGWAGTASGAQHAFVYRGRRMRDLGTLGGVVGDAHGINRAGVVVGAAQTAREPCTPSCIAPA